MTEQAARLGSYLLLDRISRGGMAEVLRAKTTGAEGFEKLVAIKRILPTIAEDEEFVRMFVDEAKLSVQLTHPNIGQVFELGKTEDTYYIAMEYIAGKDLRSILARLAERREALPVKLAVEIIAQVADGLDYAHKKKDPKGVPLNLVHRDISPANILISYEGEVKLIDFGIARAETRSTHTRAGTVKGKFAYMSPEQVRGMELDHRSDQFSLGVTLWEMLAGQRLFASESDLATLEKARSATVPPLRPLNPAVPPELEAIVRRALASQIDARFSSTGDFGEALQGWMASAGLRVTRKEIARFMAGLFPAEREKELQIVARALAGSGPHAAPEVTPRPSSATAPAGAAAQAPAELMLRRRSGEVLPCPKKTLLQRWIIEGRVAPDDEIGKRNTWRRLGDIRELQPLFAAYDAAHAVVLTPARPAVPVDPAGLVAPAPLAQPDQPAYAQAMPRTSPVPVRPASRIPVPPATAPRRRSLWPLWAAPLVIVAMGVAVIAFKPATLERLGLRGSKTNVLAQGHYDTGREHYFKGSRADLETARKDFERALEFAKGSSFVEAEAALVEVHAALGEDHLEEAEALLAQARAAAEASDPAAPDLERRAKEAQTRGRKALEAAFSRVKDVVPGPGTPLELLRAAGAYYLAAGHAPQLATVLDALRARNVRDPEVLALVGRAQLSGDETERLNAERNLSEALEGKPEFSAARLALARLLAADGKPERAVAHLRALLERAPEHARAQALLAKLAPLRPPERAQDGANVAPRQGAPAAQPAPHPFAAAGPAAAAPASPAVVQGGPAAQPASASHPSRAAPPAPAIAAPAPSLAAPAPAPADPPPAAPAPASAMPPSPVAPGANTILTHAPAAAASPPPSGPDLAQILAEAHALRRKGQIKEALALFNQARDLKADSADARVGRALCYGDLTMYQLALEAFEEALQIDPSSPRAIFGVAETKSALGHKQEALTWYQKYLERHPDGEDAPAARTALERLKQLAAQ